MTPSVLTGNQARAFHLNPRLRFLLLALAAAILFLGAIRLGDLAGYDDAMYSLEAKGIVRTGDWLTPKSRGGPALEHPPLFVWTQAAFLSAFGVSDPVAKAPSALCALGAVLLAYWLARRLTGDKLAASVTMFVMLATPYFIKYAGRAMTDVPAAFLFVCAVCAWSLAEDDPRWYLAAGAFTAMASMVRGLIGFGLPIVFAAHLMAVRRRPAWRYLIPALIAALLPLAAWDGYLLLRYRGYFVNLHRGWLEREVYGPLTPPWRRYTGAVEYAWMLAKSYWPWLPAMLAGVVAVVRQRRRPLYLLLGWAGVVFLLCAISRSRVLRYMLPAYPAMAILSAIGLLKWTPRRIVERAMDWVPPLAVAAADIHRPAGAAALACHRDPRHRASPKPRSAARGAGWLLRQRGPALRRNQPTGMVWRLHARDPAHARGSRRGAPRRSGSRVCARPAHLSRANPASAARCDRAERPPDRGPPEAALTSCAAATGFSFPAARIPAV